MKSHTLIAGCLTLCAACACAETASTNSVSAAPQSVATIVARETGGRLKTLHKNTKEVNYINAQSRVKAEVIEAARAKMSEILRTPIGMKSGTFDFASPKIEGELSLYVIDDEKLPLSLVAPEGRWAFVNVAPLAKGRGEKPQFLEARVRKEMARVGCMVLGGIGSTYKQNLLSFLPDAEALDRFEGDDLPVDGMMRCSSYLAGIGVRPWRMVSYRRACQEGWAPQPTNEIQKAIWDKVHEMPTKPLKLEKPAK